MAKKDNKENGKHFQRHFRKFHSKETTGHPAYIVDEEGNVYKFVGITKSPETKNVKNIPLHKNPEPGNPEQAYARPKVSEIKKGARNTKLKGWKLSNPDKQTVQGIIDKDKKKKPRK